MEPNLKEQNAPLSADSVSGLCSVCHQPVHSGDYFCPNCGAKLNTAPLSTTVGTQVWIYAFSIILPFLCFLFIGKWPGVKYFKSKDPKAKQIGWIAWILIVLSTIVLVWYAIVWTKEITQSTINSINADMNF